MFIFVILVIRFFYIERDDSPTESNSLSDKKFDISSRFSHFDPIRSNECYSLTVCADLPDNNNPDRLHVKDETGHVFLILSKWIPHQDTIHQVFGFYPVRPASTILFKNVEPELLDNSGREYDASIARKINAAQFTKLLDFCRTIRKKYNLNKYNCYDYALEIFNSVEGFQKLPVNHVRFPFPMGSGGSPCGLYKDLQQLKSMFPYTDGTIFFGIRKAPYSHR